MKRLQRSAMLVTLACVLVTGAAGDDGSWSSSFSLNGGSIYSETDDEHIALEKELLVFTGEKTVAFFLFRNTSDHAVTITCGFPITIDLAYTYRVGDALLIELDPYGPLDLPILRFFETELRDIGSDGDDEEDPIVLHRRQVPVNEFNNSRQFLGAGNGYSGIEIRISQDGNPVPVDDILIERQARDGLSATFHYRHELTFEPGQLSEVTVEYTADLLAGSAGGGLGDVYRWNYVIGTGGTWKGPIGEFYMITPSDWKGTPAGLNTVYSGPFVNLLSATDYEPPLTERFSLRTRGVGMMDYYELQTEIEANSFARPIALAAPSEPASVPHLSSTESRRPHGARRLPVTA